MPADEDHSRTENRFSKRGHPSQGGKFSLRYETCLGRSVLLGNRSIFVLYGSVFPGRRGRNPLICGGNGGVEVPTDDHDDIGLF